MISRSLKVVSWLAVALSLTALSQAFAQGVGLPMADTAVPLPSGIVEGSVLASYNDDISFFGGRATYAMTDDLRFFGDLAWAHMPHGQDAPSVQAGGIYCIRTDLPFDTGVRAVAYKTFSDDFDRLGINAMGIADVQVYYIGWFVYGGLGVSVMNNDDREEGPSGDTRHSHVNVDPSMVLGVSIAATDDLSLCAEAGWVRETYLSAGVRFQF